MDLIPVTNSKDAELMVTQFDNSVVEDAGLLKMDFLGLRNLTIIKDCIKIIEKLHNNLIDIDNIFMKIKILSCPFFEIAANLENGSLRS